MESEQTMDEAGRDIGIRYREWIELRLLQIIGGSEMERIQHAGIRLADGRILRGRNHAEIIRQNTGKDFRRSTSKQGFITSEGRFVCRIDAGKIAGKAGQVEVKDLRCGGVLMSEDLSGDSFYIEANK